MKKKSEKEACPVISSLISYSNNQKTRSGVTYTSSSNEWLAGNVAGRLAGWLADWLVGRLGCLGCPSAYLGCLAGREREVLLERFCGG